MMSDIGSSYIDGYMEDVMEVTRRIDRDSIAKVLHFMVKTRDSGGRLFILGVGGSAANASHAVNDFRKICGMQAYSPVDNVSELTARVNDEGWDTVFSAWLEGCLLSNKDLILVLSVGGGDREAGVSTNIIRALDLARERQARVVGIVGREGGYTRLRADACVLIPTVNTDRVTALAESFQAVIWHLLVCHPTLQKNPMKWESIE